LERGAESIGEIMNLRSIRPSSGDAETKSNAADPKAPHVFREAIHGSGVCVVCSHGRGDPRHRGVEEETSGRWGF
jgi:hypothetical protein